MIRFPDEADALLADTDNAGDDADLLAGIFEHAPLFDVRLQVGGMAFGIELQERAAAQPCRGDHIPQRPVVPARRRGDVLGSELAAKGATAEAAVQGTFFVLKGDHVNGAVCRLVAFAEGAGDLQSVDDAEGTIQPAATRLGIGVRTDQQRRPSASRAPEDIPDAIDLGIESGCAHALDEPVARLDVLR